MTKSFTIKTTPEEIGEFEWIKTEESCDTHGETLTKMREIYWLYKETLAKYRDFQKDFLLMSESFPELPEVFPKISEVFQKMSEENQRMSAEILEKSETLENQPDYAAKISEKDLEISRLSEENQRMSGEIQQMSETNRRLAEAPPAARPVSEKWSAIAQAYADLNDMADGHDVVWHVFGSYTENNLDPGLKRPSRDTIDEIKSKFTN